jgi:hypothetical protein
MTIFLLSVTIHVLLVIIKVATYIIVNHQQDLHQFGEGYIIQTSEERKKNQLIHRLCCIP